MKTMYKSVNLNHAGTLFMFTTLFSLFVDLCARVTGTYLIPAGTTLNLDTAAKIANISQYRTVASTAFIALPEVFIGLIPGWSGATILAKMIGPTNAVKVILQNSLNTSYNEVICLFCIPNKKMAFSFAKFCKIVNIFLRNIAN